MLEQRPRSGPFPPKNRPSTEIGFQASPRSGQLNRFQWATTRRYDCEDRVRSLMVLGCGLVTAGVTHGMTGFCALVRLVRSWSPAPARLEELA